MLFTLTEIKVSDYIGTWIDDHFENSKEKMQLIYCFTIPRLGTCGEADLHGSLSVPEHLKLGKRYFIGNAH